MGQGQSPMVARGQQRSLGENAQLSGGPGTADDFHLVARAGFLLHREIGLLGSGNFCNSAEFSLLNHLMLEVSMKTISAFAFALVIATGAALAQGSGGSGGGSGGGTEAGKSGQSTGKETAAQTPTAEQCTKGGIPRCA